MLTEVTTTFNLSDYIGGNYDPRRTKVYLTTNAEKNRISDKSTGEIRLGGGTVTLAADGAVSATTWAPGVDANPASWQTTFHIDYVNAATRQRQTVAIGPFTITTSGLLTALDVEQTVPAEYLTTVTQQLDMKVTAAETARAGAEAARDAADALVLSDLGTSDGQMTAVANNPSSQFSSALSASFVQGGEASAGARRGDLAGVPRSPLVTSALYLETPYSHDAQAVHPDIVDAGVSGWNGYRYWLVVTPYTNTTTAEENPTLFASTDGANWVPAPGAPAPLMTPPTSGGTFSDPDMVLVSGTMHVYGREYGPGYEKIWRITSTNGSTWSAPSLVIEISTGNPSNNLILSPAVVHDGTQFLMFSSKNFNAIEKRTSADGATWSAPSAVTLTGGPTPFGHLDVINAGAGNWFMLLQTYGGVGTSEAPDTGSEIRLGRSSNSGASWTFATAPILDARGVSTRNIYRTTGLWESRDGADYFRLWFSGIDYANGQEVWRVGYTEGWAPDEAQPATGLAVPGNVEVDGDLAAVQGGFRRLTSRLGMFTRVVTDRLFTNQARIGFAIFDQKRLATANPSWNTGFGYGGQPAVVVQSAPGKTSAQGSMPVVALVNKSSDLTNITADDRYDIRVNNTGVYQVVFHDASPLSSSIVLAVTHQGDLTALRDITGTRNVKGTQSVSSARGDFGPGADGTQPADNPLRVMGDNLRITTARTPTSSADSFGNTGTWCWDANYVYVKTATGWKRAALTAW